MVKDGKNFIIDGGPERIHSIFAADKSPTNDVGTAIGFESGANASLTLRHIIIDGGGDAPSSTGGDPDPAIIVKNGRLVLEHVLIRHTHGGGIQLDGSGTITLRHFRARENRVAAGSHGSAITVSSSGTVIAQGNLVLRDNDGGKGALWVQDGGTFDIAELRCKSVAHNRNADGEEVEIVFEMPPGPAWTALWDSTPRVCPTDGNPNGGSGGGDDDDGKSGQCILGTVGSYSVYCIARFADGTVLLQIYRVDDNSVGHWVMNVSQAAIDAVSGPGCVAASPDGRYAVRVWVDRNITIYDGPDHENKVYHNTLKEGVSRTVLETLTTHSSTPPGMGCPGYAGD